MASVKNLAAFALLIIVSAHSHGNPTITLNLPPRTPPGTQTVDSAFFSYSIELSYIVDYAGNLTHPNTFSHQLLSNIQSITGTLPHIRVGGTTQNHATFIPDQTVALIQNFSSPGADQPDSLTIGPAFFESFKTFPNGTKYVYGLNFFDGEAGKAQTVLEAWSAWQALGETIDAFEIGNEFDAFPVNRTNATWSLETYVAQWLDYTGAIRANLSLAAPRFQAGVFASAAAGVAQLGPTPWTAETALDAGIASTGLAKTFSEHAYMGAACAGSPPVSLAGTLLNHTHLTRALAPFVAQSAASASRRLPYVIGETNSVACQGAAGVSDVFGAALWAVDYALWAAARTDASGLFFHAGTGYRYAAWWPGGAVKPGYYAHLVVAGALGGGGGAGSRVAVVVEEERWVVYGVYGVGGDGEEVLRHVVAVDLADGRSAAGVVGRRVRVPGRGRNDGLLEVRRLTAPAVDSAEGIEWAGRTVDGEGRIVGEEKVEKVAGSEGVFVGHGEAVLITF